MIDKLTDAASMFWMSLDERERILILLAGVWVATTVYMAAGDQRRRRDEDRLFARLHAEMEANR